MSALQEPAGHGAIPAGAATTPVYVARQPIFAGGSELHAYELLYRSGTTNAFDGTDDDTATARVIMNSFSAIGLERLTGGRPAFINFPKNLLLNDCAMVLPPELVVVEVLETVPPEPEVFDACERIKAAGFLIAVDDVSCYNEEYAPLFDLADVIKIDFMATPPDERRTLARRLGRSGRRLLAEKVETQEEVDQAAGWGYTYFQGYFFSKPNIVAGKDVAPLKISYLKLMGEVNKLDFNVGRVEEAVRSDVSLTYKLLRYINSAAMGWRHRIETVRHALVALGEIQFRKWVALVCFTGMADDKPRELVVKSLVRAYLCEKLAPLLDLRKRQADLFLVGLFSLLDAVLDAPLDDLLAKMPLAPEVTFALTAASGPFHTALDLALACEAAEWERLESLAGRAGIDGPVVAALYLDAVREVDLLLEDE